MKISPEIALLYNDLLNKLYEDPKLFNYYIHQVLTKKNYNSLASLINYTDNEQNNHNRKKLPELTTETITTIIVNEDYKALEIIIEGYTTAFSTTSYTDIPTTLSCIMEEAIKRLNIKAVKILLEEASNSEIDVSLFNIYKYFEINDLNKILEREYYKQYSTARPKDFVKIYVAAIHRQHNKNSKKFKGLDEANLEELANYLTKKEFNKFIEKQDIELTKFNIKFKDYELENAIPLIRQDIEPKSLEDFLLKRTYADKARADEITKIYHYLFLSHDFVVKDTMKMLVASIKKGDNLKIVFNNNFNGSFYSPYNNIIEISFPSAYSCITLSALLIHEIGHYIFYKLYGLGIPLDFDLLIKGLPTPEKEFDSPKQLINSSNIYTGVKEILKFIKDEKTITDFFPNQTDISKINKLLNAFQTYTKGLTQLLLYYLTLLQVENAEVELNKCDSIEDLLNYLKNSAPDLDLFLIKPWFFEQNKDIKYKYNISSYINVVKAYINGTFSFNNEDISKITTNQTTVLTLEKLNYRFNEILDQDLDLIIKEKSLTSDQICLLQRADFVNYYFEELEQNTIAPIKELIVRYAELQVKGINQEELNKAFKDLIPFWEQYISPDIQSYVAEACKNKTSMVCKHILPHVIGIEYVDSQNTNLFV